MLVLSSEGLVERGTSSAPWVENMVVGEVGLDTAGTASGTP